MSRTLVDLVNVACPGVNVWGVLRTLLQAQGYLLIWGVLKSILALLCPTETQINKSRPRANIEVGVHLFYFSVDYTHDERANIAKQGCKRLLGKVGTSRSGVVYT